MWRAERIDVLTCCNTADVGYDNQDMEDDVVFDGGYQVPGSIYNPLFDYQKTGMLPACNGTGLLSGT